MKLLKQMGWKEKRKIGAHGQHQADERVDEAKAKGHDAIIQAILQAQQDIDVVLFHPKSDRRGLGYQMSAEEQQSREDVSRFGTFASSSHRVGEDGEGDDVYGEDDLSNYTICSNRKRRSFKQGVRQTGRDGLSWLGFSL